jgi:Exostosin family
MQKGPIPKLKLFSDRRYLPDKMPPASILYPFWRDLHQSQLRSWISPYHRYLEFGHQFFTLTPSLEESDLAILPMDWGSIRGDTWRSPIDRTAKHLAQAYAEKVADANKPLVVMFSSDCSDEAIDLDFGYQPGKIFRQSAYRSRHQEDPQSSVMPFFCEDYIQSFFQGQLPTRYKTNTTQPVLSFCGFARPLNLKRQIQAIGYKSYMLATQQRLAVSIYKGQSLRYQVLNQLQASSDLNHPKSSGINPNFIIREQAIFFQATDKSQKEKSRVEFLENIINSDYVFCCRGAANYSNRFYEALACGRIPVLLDTDCQLPFEEFINWNLYCIRVSEQSTPQKTADEIVKRILDFHHSKSSQEFTELQHQCYRLWKDWLSPEGFYSNFFRSFSRAISKEAIPSHYK